MDINLVGPLISSIGKNDFGAVLFKLLSEHLAPTLLTLTTINLDKALTMQCLEVGPDFDLVSARRMQTLYEKEFRQFDPVHELAVKLWTQPVSNEPHILIHQMAASEITYKPWRELAYEQFNLVDRVGVGVCHPTMGWLYLTLIRHAQHGCFSAADIQWLINLSPLLLRIALRHKGMEIKGVGGVSNISSVAYRLRQISSSLTDREIAVCEQLLTGKTNKQIGHMLNISANTVKTYRFRSFAKLGIKSRFELMAFIVG